MECSTCPYALEKSDGGYGCILSVEDMDLCPYIINGGRHERCPKNKPKNASDAEK